MQFLSGLRRIQFRAVLPYGKVKPVVITDHHGHSRCLACIIVLCISCCWYWPLLTFPLLFIYLLTIPLCLGIVSILFLQRRIYFVFIIIIITKVSLYFHSFFFCHFENRQQNENKQRRITYQLGKKKKHQPFSYFSSAKILVF